MDNMDFEKIKQRLVQHLKNNNHHNRKNNMKDRHNDINMESFSITEFEKETLSHLNELLDNLRPLSIEALEKNNGYLDSIYWDCYSKTASIMEFILKQIVINNNRPHLIPWVESHDMLLEIVIGEGVDKGYFISIPFDKDTDTK